MEILLVETIILQIIMLNRGTNNNPSKIPTTGAAVSNYVIGGIGAIVSIIGAYLFKKKK